MEILCLSLKNFKGHQDEYFEFSRGTNAICGENGAGKTSIFEAIAWVLFDHCDYQKKELIRSGAKSATASVEFLSGLDGRCYRIKRNTQKGYELYDPQINEKLNVKKREDVQKWLREHLGVPRNTELSRLFAETIGIPQGTFTADFLKRPGDRKKIFDPILKVEDYKQTYDNTRDLETYAKAQVSQLQQKIDLASAQLTDWDTLKSEFKTLSADIGTDQAAIESLNTAILSQQESLTSLQTLAQELETLSKQHQELEQTFVHLKAEQTQLNQMLEQAKRAVQICETNQTAYQQYVETQAQLNQLQAERQQYQSLITQQSQLNQSLTQLKVQQSGLSSQLQGFEQLESQIETLKPLMTQQIQLDQQRIKLQQAIQSMKMSEGQCHSLTQQIHRLVDQQNALLAEIKACEGLDEKLSTLPALEQDRQAVMKSMGQWEVSQYWLAKLQPVFAQGKLDRDRHRTAVQSALKLIEAHPEALTDIESALKEGAILNTGLLKSIHLILTELGEAASPERLNQKLNDINLHIQELQQLQTQQSMAQAKQQQWQASDRHINELKQQLSQAQANSEGLPSHLAQQKQVEADLATLGNPKSQIDLLQGKLREKATIQNQLETLSTELSQLSEQQSELETQLTQFQQLDHRLTETQTQLNQYQEGHQLYLLHKENADRAPALIEKLDQMSQQHIQLVSQQKELQGKKDSLSRSFDADALQQLQSRVQANQVQLGELRGGLAPKEQRLQQIQSQLEKKQNIFDQSQQHRAQLTAKQEIYTFIQEARRIYNQSGPRISELYQQEISFEADRLFRELLHRQDVALRWTEDYDIQVQDAGHWRTFKSLSGGEQMCAALAVRLALLKTLADISIAFFDEPTTNMDEIRRSQLAEAISNLKSFTQLFVISHDDTFEAITESIIRLESKSI